MAQMRRRMSQQRVTAATNVAEHTRAHTHAHTLAHTPSRLHTSAQASKLNLVDLAGSERQEPSDADGNGSLNPDGTGSAVDASPRPRGAVDPSLALRESININSGLLALLNVRSPFLSFHRPPVETRPVPAQMWGGGALADVAG